MRLYTNLEQSIKLAEILPLDSADYYYGNGNESTLVKHEWSEIDHDEDDIPCWSLGKLLDLIQVDYKIEKFMLDQTGIFLYEFLMEDEDYRTFCQEELIDACIEFILELKKRDLLF
jgi:hypothetical protein